MRTTLGMTRIPKHSSSRTEMPPKAGGWLRLVLPVLTLLGLGAAGVAVLREAQARAGIIVPPSAESATPLPNPVLFVTQVPLRDGYTTITSTFGNHRPEEQRVPRGGDLWIRYPDGVLKNLTRAAGFGTDPEQGIAVRDPSVHWDGRKAVFSMVVGRQGVWQLYELTGLGLEDTPSISKLANQPAYNNISPTYGSDDRIIFTSDRPRGGEAHLYPQRDEYEAEPTVTGLWSLEPASGDLRLLNHAPSGNFTPIVDSFGRVLFTQWDHLQRDQLSDRDRLSGGSSGTFDYASEAADAAKAQDRLEVFPEPRDERDSKGSNLNPHEFNHFFPWTVLEDGSEGEVLNHLGRHELRKYMQTSLNDDPALRDFDERRAGRFNPTPIDGLFQIKEDPTEPGRYVATNAPEFFTHASGQLVSLYAPPEASAGRIAVTSVTAPETYTSTPENAQPHPAHSGHYRDPLPLADGTLLASHAPETRKEAATGAVSRYAFRLRTLALAPDNTSPTGSSDVFMADKPLTPGLEKTVDGKGITLWELNAVEVTARERPERRAGPGLEPPEAQMLEAAGVNPQQLREFLVRNNLALMVTRNVTTRDNNDRQQPFNLRVPGGTETSTGSGKVYDVTHLQLFQADQVRGLGGRERPRPGRRVLARPMHEAAALEHNPKTTGAPAGSVALASDGSLAAFVPTRRAMSWQLTDKAGTPVVRERYWVTFQPGEVRVCGSCHGLSERDQLGREAPTNPPKALLELLRDWKNKSK